MKGFSMNKTKVNEERVESICRLPSITPGTFLHHTSWENLMSFLSSQWERERERERENPWVISVFMCMYLYLSYEAFCILYSYTFL
jgi:hypothetical protein